MNMRAKPPLTAAEQALIDGFTQRLGDLPGDAAVTALRDRMIEDIKEHGLPTRRVESWHYTDFRVLLKDVPAYDPAAFDDKLDPLVANANVVGIVNGTPRIAARLPDGIAVGRLSERLQQGGVAERLQPRGSDDAIGRINTSFVTDGLEIAIANGAEISVPIELQLLHAGGQMHTRFPVEVGANAAATIVERRRNATGDAALTSVVTDLSVGPDATITYVIVQEEGAADTSLGQMNVTLAENARLTLHVLNAGGKLVRQEIHVATKGEGADLQLRGVNLLDDDSHTDVTFTLGHDVANTTSTETLRNVVFGRARGVFQGQIRVAPDAQRTDARMASNTLLLSDEGEFSTKPELEIFADDVQCAHGATVADIDANHLFYLMSRGIPEARARGLLVKAFVNEVVEELEDEALVDALHNVIENWLEQRS